MHISLHIHAKYLCRIRSYECRSKITESKYLNKYCQTFQKIVLIDILTCTTETLYFIILSKISHDKFLIFAKIMSKIISLFKFVFL